ncbi:YagK/YfjJ domain-containing protein [Catenovulum sp. SX2]|uniref:YagK/YfjJ domain-containing protein n=1 Tax=Catenovulum sp. SX2 TaxID=3398614 RepID=UPI003F83B7BF
MKINVVKDSGVFAEYMGRYKSQVDLMSQHHRKVFAIPLTIQFMRKKHAQCKDYEKYHNMIRSGDNSLLSEAMRDFSKYLKGQYGRDVNAALVASNKPSRSRPTQIRRLGYCWAREQKDGDEYPHYHIWLLLDGSQVKSPFDVVKWLNDRAKAFNLALFYAKGAKRIDRKDPSLYWSLLHHISYLAKESSKDKELVKKGSNRYGASKLRPPNDIEWKGFTYESVRKQIQKQGRFFITQELENDVYRSEEALLEDIRSSIPNWSPPSVITT